MYLGKGIKEAYWDKVPAKNHLKKKRIDFGSQLKGPVVHHDQKVMTWEEDIHPQPGNREKKVLSAFLFRGVRSNVLMVFNKVGSHKPLPF